MTTEFSDFSEETFFQEPAPSERERNRTMEAGMIISSMACATASAILGATGEYEAAGVFAAAGISMFSGGLYLGHKDRKETEKIEMELARSKIIDFPQQKL